MKTITITVEGGLILDIAGIPKGVRVEVWDFDIEGCDPEHLETTDYGDEYCLSVYAGQS